MGTGECICERMAGEDVYCLKGEWGGVAKDSRECATADITGVGLWPIAPDDRSAP